MVLANVVCLGNLLRVTAIEDRSRRELLLTWVGAFAFWTLITLFYLSQLALRPGQEPSARHALAMVSWQLVSGYLWAAATPLVFQIARSVPLDSLLRAVALHSAAGAATVAAHLVAQATVLWSLGTLAGDSDWSRSVMLSFHWWAQSDALAYGGTLAAGLVFRYQRQLRDRELATSRLETELARAQLARLELQLSPHMLFNTLHTVTGLIRQGDGGLAIRLLAGFGGLLRRTLDRDLGQETLLGEELDWVESYLEIQRIRFPDRLEVRVEAAPEVRGARLPSLILQPLIENALHHGMGNAGGGAIAIRARRAEDRLEVEVEDRAKDLRQATGGGPKAGADERHGFGIGLANVRERLDRLYGQRQELRLESRNGCGTKVVLSIPWQVEPLVSR